MRKEYDEFFPNNFRITSLRDEKEYDEFSQITSLIEEKEYDEFF